MVAANFNLGVSYVQNGVGSGPAGAMMNVTNRFTGSFDTGLLRPFIETDPNSPDLGRPCAEIRTGRMIYNNARGTHHPERKKYRIDRLQSEFGINSPVFNATTLTRDNWIQIDARVEKARRLRLTAWNDLLQANPISGFDAWSKWTYEYNTSSDAGSVVSDMDATSPARDDTVLHLIRSVPLPVIHGDFSYPQRLLDSTRASGQPLDTEMFEQITRRFWECVEKKLIGTETGVLYGGRAAGPFPTTGTSKEFGYTNFEYRVTKTDLTTPAGTNPQDVKTDVQEMIETMQTNGYFGPYVLYHSTGYSQYLNDDYFRSGSTSAVRSLKERLMELDDISSIRRLDYLTSGFQLLLVDLGSGQFGALDGMRPKTVMWSERGGYVAKFMVLGIQVPILRAPPNGVAGLIHGTTS